MADFVEIKRPRPDYSQIFANMAPGLSSGMSSQNDLHSVLMPLLFKADLERKAKMDELAFKMNYAKKMRDELFNRADGKDLEITEFDEYFMPKGAKIRTAKEKLDNILAEKRLRDMDGSGGQIPSVVSSAMGGSQDIPEIVKSATTQTPPPEFIANPNYPMSGDQFVKNPARDEWNKIEEEKRKPVAAEVATKFSGAKQGIENIRRISDTLNLKLGDGGKISVGKNVNSLVVGANRAIEAANAKDTFLPMGKAIYRGAKLSNVTPEQSSLANEFMTLAENILRARTGAQAPEPEVVREYARSLLKTWSENPETWQRKLDLELNFLNDVVTSVRPHEKSDVSDVWKSKTNTSSLPSVGGDFNGEKVIRVTRIK